MSQRTFQHLSTYIGQRQLGLGWLSGITVMETERAVTTDWHRHTTTEMLMCLRGETRYEFRDHPPVTLCAGSYLVIPSGAEHRVSNAIDEPGKRIGLNLRHASDPKRRFAVFTAQDYARFRLQLEAEAYHPKACSPEMRRTLAKFDGIVSARSLTSVEYGHLRILCCTLLYEAVLPPAATAGSRSKIMDEAVNWLETHFSEDVSMDRLIAFMGYSRARFFALFREHTGSSPNDYLQRIRIRQAQKLLCSATTSAREVAAACGFADNGYFTRIFKRQTGLTPLGYRKRFANQDEL